MTKEEVKKELYKQKPAAYLLWIRNGVACYRADLIEAIMVTFEVPVSDMGNAAFFPEMDAKLLIRWITDTMALK